jgi:hypothetical protein
MLQIALRFVEESEQSSPADVIDKAVEGHCSQKNVVKEEKVQT